MPKLIEGERVVVQNVRISANACKTYSLQKHCMKLVSKLSVVQAEITLSKIFLASFRSVKYRYLYSYWYFAERNGTKSEIKLSCI